MLRSIKFFFFISTIACSLVLSPVALAQADTEGSGTDALIEESVNDFITVGALGGVGFVLGLSTLAFVNEPTDHLKNLWVGFAFGIIAGVGVVAWKQANKSQKEIYENSYIKPKEFGTANRIAWHREEVKSIKQTSAQISFEPLKLNYQFSF